MLFADADPHTTSTAWTTILVVVAAMTAVGRLGREAAFAVVPVARIAQRGAEHKRPALPQLPELSDEGSMVRAEPRDLLVQLLDDLAGCRRGGFVPFPLLPSGDQG